MNSEHEPGEPGKVIAGRTMAPANHRFAQNTVTIYLISSFDDDRRLSEVYQIDEKHYRFLWNQEAIKKEDAELSAALDRCFSRLDENGKEQKDDPPYLKVFFLIYSILLSNNAFTGKTSWTDFKKSAISFLNGKEEFIPWVTRWSNVAAGRLPIETVKVSHKLEKNKVYIEKIGQQLSLMFSDEQEELIKTEKIDIVGMNLSVAEDNSLFAIQSLMSDNDYRPTWTDEATGKVGFAFTVPAYLDACGVSKKKNKSGKMEYDVNGRRAHLSALEQLSRRTFIIVYGSKPDKKGDRWEMRSVEILFKLHTLVKVTKTGREYVQGYAITDYDHSLGLDIVDYFLLMPRGIKNQIRQLTGRGHTRGHDRFISNIFTDANEKRRLEAAGKSPDWTIEFSHSTILSRPEFAAMAAKRNYSMIWKQWRAYCELGVQMGYIEKVETVNGKKEKKDIIKLNRQKFCELWPTMNPNNEKV